MNKIKSIWDKINSNRYGVIGILLFAVLLLIPFSVTTLPSQTFYESLKDATEVLAIHNPSNKQYTLEVAVSPEKHEIGLMNRTFLDSDKGMLFAFSDLSYRTFWMRNTLISLDIIYLDQDFRVVSYYENTQPNQVNEVYSSNFPAKYVIEVNGGESGKMNLKVGDLFEIKE